MSYFQRNGLYLYLMLQINFYPESDKIFFIKAANEYSEIWKKDRQKIIKLIEKYSQLTFKTKVINAVTFEGISYSTPMRLKSSYSSDQKETTLVHELLHRLLVDNNFWFDKKDTFHEDIHKIIDLILYDIWVELLGKDLANKSKDIEIGYGDPTYKKAWDWALSFSKKQRALKFQEMTKRHPRGE